MAITLDNTIAGSMANSYADRSWADDYWVNHFNTTRAANWAALSDTQKDYALVHACRQLEQVRFTVPITHTDRRFRAYYNRITGQVMNFELLRHPIKFFFYQKLQFPRNLDINLDTGQFYIPEPILMAQCEQAAYLLEFDDAMLSSQLQGVKMETIGVGRRQVEVNQMYLGNGTAIAPMAFELLKPYLVRNSTLNRA